MTIFDSACIPCILQQSFNMVNNIAPSDEEFKKIVLTRVCRIILNAPEGTMAPHLSAIVQKMITKYKGIADPYAEVKAGNLKNAISYELVLDSFLNLAQDKLEGAVRIAIAGNTIDIGANPDFNIEEEVRQLGTDNIALDMFPQFARDIKKAGTILYIADNLEEAVFDKYLLRQFSGKRIFFAVRSKPILNDITFADAIELGIDKLATVIESGSAIPGTDMKLCTPEFKSLLNSCDVVIAKGQGNYETLMDQKRCIYFLFKVKCATIAKHSGFEVGKSVLYKNNFFNNPTKSN